MFKSSTYLLLLGLFLSIMSCKSDTSDGAPDAEMSVEQMTAVYNKDKSPANGQKLLSSIFKAAQEDKSKSESLYETGIQYADELKNLNFKAACLNSLIKDYYSSPQTPERISTLASILQNDFKRVNASLALKRGYIDAFPDGAESKKYKSDLPDYAENIDSFIYYIGNKIINTKTRAFQPEMAREYVNVSEGIALAYPGFERTPDYLFNAAKTANTIKDNAKALALYDWVIDKYPNHKLSSKSLFMKAFTFDTDLNDEDSAQKLYEEFVKKYPNDDLADDAAFLLENIGLSEEELLNKIQGKQKAQSE